MKDSPYSEPALATAYAAIARPAQFDAPARDLVATLRAPRGGTGLDVGTGTGAVGIPLAESVGPGGLVVGIDASTTMLRARSAHSGYRVAVGRVPGLPFHDDVFDVVAAGFVVSHMENYDAGLADMVRVCKGGGRVGISAWGSKTNPVAKLWKDVASTVAPSARLDDAFRGVIPWDAWFTDPDNMNRALRDARMTAIEIITRDYVVRLPTADFLSMKAATVEGMLLREMIDADAWSAFTRDVGRAFQREFGDAVEYVRDVVFGIATKPGS